MSETGQDWRERAECRDEDSEMFFPDGVTDAEEKTRRINGAKRLCLHCRVLEQCLDYALTTDQKDGIYAGKTYEERQLP